MSFLNPAFLWALFILSIPVLIHLLNFRRHKTIYFSNVSLLKKTDNQSKNIKRLRDWLILASRLLAMAFLVFAFAQPFIPASDDAIGNTRFASIYIDNSQSMQLSGSKARKIDEAREQAIEIIRSLPDGYQIQIVTNNFNGREQQFYSKEQAIDLVDRIDVSESFRTLKQVKQRFADALQNENVNSNTPSFYLTDLQENTLQNFELLPEEESLVQFIKFENPTEVENLAIDSIWFSRPVLQKGIEQLLNFRLKNYSKRAFENLNINLNLNGQTLGSVNISVPALASADTSFSIIPGPEDDFYYGFLDLTSTLPEFDNRKYLSFSTASKTRVLLISDVPASWFQRLYADSIFQVETTTTAALNFNAFSQYDLIILNQISNAPNGLVTGLQTAMQQHTNVFFFPASADNQWVQNLGINLQELQQNELNVNRIIYTDDYYEGVFTSRPERAGLPKVKQYFPFTAPLEYPLLKLENGQNFVSRSPMGNSQLFISAVAPEKTFSNFQQHPIFVPILLNAALFASGTDVLYLDEGNTEQSLKIALQNSNTDAPVKIAGPDGEIIPPQRSNSGQIELFEPYGTLEAGTYPIIYQSDTLGYLAINADKRESELSYAQQLPGMGGTSKILTASAATTATLQSSWNGIELWPWCIAFSLLFIAIEILLLTLWKN